MKESVNQRFEQVDKQFEKVDKSFEQVDKRLDDMKAESTKRFDKLETKYDHFQWIIISLIIATFFKEQLSSLFM